MADIPESAKMLPCPFCNLSTARVIEPANGTTPYVMCTNCTGAGPQLRRDEAIAAWNTRAAPPAMDREAVERVREAVYRQALEDVCNPLGYLQRMADAEGATLGGMAYAIASDIGTIQRIAKDALSTLSADAIRQGEGWQSIETAPFDEEVIVQAGEMTFRAKLLPDAGMNALEEPCDQWVATREGEHPPCWTGGLCWESNEDDVTSIQPRAWMLVTPASRANDGGEA